MSEVFSHALAFATIGLGGWVAIFGTIGAILARNRGACPLSGLLLGGALGPLGWGLVWFDTVEAQAARPERLPDDLDEVWRNL